MAAALIVLFLRNVDFRHVLAAIVRARVDWLALSLASMFVNLALRAWRWQYLLEPIGTTSFAGAFRATAVGFAASTVLPARAGEFIRPYFLSRQNRVSATGAFATVILERLLDVVTVLAFLAVYGFLFGRRFAAANPVAFERMTWVGAAAGAGAAAALAVLFVLAGDPARIGRAMERLARVVPSALAGMLARVAEKFARGLGAIRRPRRLVVAAFWSVPLWLSIAAGIWAAAAAFDLGIDFAGSFLIIALLSLGVTVPTPGAIGGFHFAFRYGATTFFGAPDDAAVGAAIVLHLLSVGPALGLGLLFAAQEGLNMSGIQRLADQAEHRSTALP
ncbi:MAG: flippase-like domain-containing protein [Acidobacteria bacterium]|nr:flippase-like domain-containing protein [Acidobacteriota bacterium]